ncbi:MAG TPA: AarF/ABC1/UbiB kinase family protein, partial [Alphaproteobacteria bacterium]|nr:AarF/ABC1/UbiB kinase family protein [Alphaproteobacteria bacterium]
FSGRLKRYSNVTTAVGGLMARLFGDRYLGISINEPQHAEALKETLGHLKGPLMKIAQILATVPDILPEEYATAFLELQSNAPPMGWPFVKRRMQTELGPDWRSKFLEFEPNASAAASLGQVHKAIDLKGRHLACKLQYPEMGSAVEADLNQLKFILKSFEIYSGALDTENLRLEIGDRLREELDYLLEAKNIKLFKEMLASFPFVEVPEVIDSLTTPRLLSMTWLEGDKLLTLKDSPQDLRDEVSTSLFKVWYYPLYQYGILHGDPHLGNYSWSRQNKLNLLDFGCIRVFKAPLIEGVLDLYKALQTNDEELAVHAYRTWGFKDIDRELIEILNLWAQFLYEPLLDDRIRPIEETQSGFRGRKVAGAVLDELKRRGGVKPPREFVFMDRAAVGIGAVFMHLRAQANWHQLFEELIHDFSASALEARQSALFEKVSQISND